MLVLGRGGAAWDPTCKGTLTVQPGVCQRTGTTAGIQELDLL